MTDLHSLIGITQASQVTGGLLVASRRSVPQLSINKPAPTREQLTEKESMNNDPEMQGK